MRTILTLAIIGALAVPAGLPGGLEAREQDKSSGAHSSARPPSNWWKTQKYMQELKLTTEQSSEIEQDLPAHLVDTLENGSFGHDYILALDEKLLRATS